MSDTIIYWFSGTGNSLHTARSIAEGLKGKTEMISIADAMRSKDPLKSAPRMGLVFPIYGCGPPLIVQRFMRKLPTEHVSFVFAAATYAGMLGAGGSITSRLLERRGLKLNAMYAIKMPENYPPMGGPPKSEKRERLLREAEEKIQHVITDLNREEPNGMDQANVFSRTAGKIGNPLFVRNVLKADKKFYADEKCTQCGICAAVCPVENIFLKNGTPVWQHHCEQCFACLHWCPEAAVQYGGRSPHQPRYHHPKVELNDIMPSERIISEPDEETI